MSVPANSLSVATDDPYRLHQQAAELVKSGDYRNASAIYHALETRDLPSGLRRLVRNNQAVLAAVSGKMASAIPALQQALADDPEFSLARNNLHLLRGEDSTRQNMGRKASSPQSRSGMRVVLLSFFMNWPSPAGGIVHTIELMKFLSRAGYEVTLLHPQYDPWQIGQVQDCPVPVETVPFTDRDWNRADIQRRIRQVVDRLNPDSVIVTDCWNFKPHLVEALSGYRVFLRMQAHECLCPLNNLRIKPRSGGGMAQCPVHQLVNREECLRCLSQHAASSGTLHRLDRNLSEVDSPEYETRLRRSLHEAEAVIVLNPLIAEVLRPYCRRVETITWGMDPARFPEPLPRRNAKPLRILFAGLPEEPIKGWDTLRSAGRLLWQKRQDWELVITGQAAGSPEPFARSVGWQSQEELPALYREADIVAVPTLVQDGLSRTAVEGMASGRAVVASRLGAMPFLISEGVTGLLCKAGDAGDWAQALDRLLDDAEQREELGRNGRRVFCERFSWERVIERDYRPLLAHQPN